MSGCLPVRNENNIVTRFSPRKNFLISRTSRDEQMLCARWRHAALKHRDRHNRHYLHISVEFSLRFRRSSFVRFKRGEIVARDQNTVQNVTLFEMSNKHAFSWFYDSSYRLVVENRGDINAIETEVTSYEVQSHRGKGHVCNLLTSRSKRHGWKATIRRSKRRLSVSKKKK